jgi:hypothetical protein
MDIRCSMGLERALEAKERLGCLERSGLEIKHQ